MTQSIAVIKQRLTPTNLDRLAWLLNALLVILLASSLARLTWLLVPQPAADTMPPPAQQNVARGGANQQVDYSRLASRHFLGEKAKDTAVAQAAPVDAPETKLNVTLRGILYNDDPDFARAIIAEPGKPDEHYKIGDQVAGSASIERILPDKVILNRGGRFETLTLPEESLDVPVQSVSSADSEGGGMVAGSGDALNEYRRQIIENPQSAMQFIQAEPVNAGNGLAGFRIRPGADARMFQLAGLESGDIVTQVNDVRLDNFDKGFEAIETLAASDVISLTVLRGGQEQTVRLDLRN